MKKRIALVLLAILIGLLLYNELSSSPLIPKARLFGNSTVLVDSTNYVTLNKGLYAFDSIKTDRDLIVKGAIVLDTQRLGKIYYNGYSVYANNDKAGGNWVFQLMNSGAGSAGNFIWLWGNILTGTTAMELDSVTGLNVNTGNISVSGTTQQIKVPGDTVSDYDANDAVTISRQSGTITTKSLTTTVGNTYALTVTNTLCATTSKVFVNVSAYTGTGFPIVFIVNPGSGSFVITLLSALTTLLNAPVELNYFLVNQ
jgi:hypothetical protein